MKAIESDTDSDSDFCMCVEGEGTLLQCPEEYEFNPTLGQCYSVRKNIYNFFFSRLFHFSQLNAS